MSIATNVKSVARNRNAVIFAASTLSGIGGAIAGYKYAEKMLAAKYAEISDTEIALAREHYTMVFKDGQWADPSVLAEKYVEAEEKLETLEDQAAEAEAEIKVAAQIIEDNQYVSYNKPQDIPETVVTRPQPAVEVKNIFIDHANVMNDDGDRYDVEAESAKKRAKRPYIVEKDEFEINDEEREKSCLTWFEEDDKMVDENDRALTTSELQSVIGGVENLRFGYGSGDENTVFIYNDKLDAAFEVTRDERSYAEVVLGINDNVLTHSDRPPIRKMRRED